MHAHAHPATPPASRSCVAVLPPFFMYLEYDAALLYFSTHTDVTTELTGIIVLCGMAAFALVFTELSLIGMTSSLAFSLCATIKELLLVFISTRVNGDRLTNTNISGFVVTLSGVFWYKYLKYRDQERLSDAAARVEVDTDKDEALLLPVKIEPGGSIGRLKIELAPIGV
jgi:multidrug transporter EmrE-like cation transporter